MTIEIDIPPYPYKLIVSFNETYEAFLEDVKYLICLGNLDTMEFREHFKDPVSRGLTKRLSSGHIISAMGSKDIGLITHEMFHATVLYANTLGIEFKLENHESYAYMIQHLVSIIYKTLNL
jgi:hypothetical protein